MTLFPSSDRYSVRDGAFLTFSTILCPSGSGRHHSSSSAEQGDQSLRYHLVMDWALLLIDASRDGTNKTPPKNPFNTNGFGPTDTTIAQANDAEAQSHAFASSVVCKLGCSGGSTGRISPFIFKACIHRSGVVHKAMVVEEDRSSDYMLQGDEGCWGLNLLGGLDHFGGCCGEGGRCLLCCADFGTVCGY